MNLDSWKPFFELLSGLANFMTVISSGLAIFLYFANRKKISIAFQYLLNYSFQMTLGELKEKLERLNEYNANEPDDIDEIRGILHEISGQMRGNGRLLSAAPELADKVGRLADARKITETSRRALVSEVRESLRNIHVNSMEIRQ